MFLSLLRIGGWMRLTVLAHGDSDGVASASLVRAALAGTYDEMGVYFTHPYHLLRDFREFASGDVVIVDVALSEGVWREFLAELAGYGGRVTYIDHHPLPRGLNERQLDSLVESVRTDGSASEATFRHYSGMLDPDYDRVALYGAIADYSDTTRWVSESLGRWDRRQIYFEAGILFQGLEGSRRMHDFKREVVNHLSGNRRPSSHGELVRRALKQAAKNEELYGWAREMLRVAGCVGYLIDPPGSVGIAATYARGMGRVPVGLAAERRGGIYSMSLRGDGTVDLNSILRELTPRLGGSGGGHRDAAGARIPVDRLDELIEGINEAICGSRLEGSVPCCPPGSG